MYTMASSPPYWQSSPQKSVQKERLDAREWRGVNTPAVREAGWCGYRLDEGDVGTVNRAYIYTLEYNVCIAVVFQRRISVVIKQLQGCGVREH